MKWPNIRPRVQVLLHPTTLPSTLPTSAAMTAMLQYPTRPCPKTNTIVHHRHHHHYREHLQAPISTTATMHKEYLRPRHLLWAIQRWPHTKLSSLGHPADTRSRLLQIMGILQTSVVHHRSERIASRTSICPPVSEHQALNRIVH